MLLAFYPSYYSNITSLIGTNSTAAQLVPTVPTMVIMDRRQPARLSDASQPVTPAGLPGPFVATQAFGVLGVTMIIAGAVISGSRGVIWIFSGIVLVLVGSVGLAFWAGALLTRRSAARGR